MSLNFFVTDVLDSYRPPSPRRAIARSLPFLEKPGRSLTRIARKTRNCLGQELALILVFLRYSARTDGIRATLCPLFHNA